MTSNAGEEARVTETSLPSETTPTEKNLEQEQSPDPGAIEPAEAPSADHKRSAKTEAAPAEADLSETGDTAPSPASEPERAGAETSSSDGPPLPEGPPPGTDDGWEYHWDPNHQVYFFYNRYTQQTTWENPRVSGANATGANATAADLGASSSTPSVAGGYNPAIHGDYDPTAWYAQGPHAAGEPADLDQAGASELPPDPSLLYVSGGHFNRRTGEFQVAEQGADRHGDEAKSRRQMNAYFDVDAAANAHGGRSLRAERAGKKPSKAELKQFKEKRRAKKEEKRRAWLRD